MITVTFSGFYERIYAKVEKEFVGEWRNRCKFIELFTDEELGEILRNWKVFEIGLRKYVTDKGWHSCSVSATYGTVTMEQDSGSW